MYQLENVNKTYERRGQTVTALADSTLSLAEGEFVALVGPSGSGKTTLLSMLGGMLAPTSGRILLDGASLYDLSVQDRTRLRLDRIGFVFQSFNLIPWLSAVENVQVPLSLAGKPATEQRERATELLDRVGLSDRLEHRPSELSQGQQQRVALARTLANNPKIILADEPTGNLDPASRETAMDYLSGFHAEGRTIVMVTHDEFATGYAKRTLRLVNGVVSDEAEAARAA
ncbi:MAG: ABC transporter ATP-binding protein [Rhodopirellula sp.]|nr:ABC transporter ATP-binding protein [Rhodopirellula sp.]